MNESLKIADENKIRSENIAHLKQNANKLHLKSSLKKSLKLKRSQRISGFDIKSNFNEGISNYDPEKNNKIINKEITLTNKSINDKSREKINFYNISYFEILGITFCKCCCNRYRNIVLKCNGLNFNIFL